VCNRPTDRLRDARGPRVRRPRRPPNRPSWPTHQTGSDPRRAPNRRTNVPATVLGRTLTCSASCCRSRPAGSERSRTRRLTTACSTRRTRSEAGTVESARAGVSFLIRCRCGNERRPCIGDRGACTSIGVETRWRSIACRCSQPVCRSAFRPGKPGRVAPASFASTGFDRLGRRRHSANRSRGPPLSWPRPCTVGSIGNGDRVRRRSIGCAVAR
jgi:hypothetical protein